MQRTWPSSCMSYELWRALHNHPRGFVDFSGNDGVLDERDGGRSDYISVFKHDLTLSDGETNKGVSGWQLRED